MDIERSGSRNGWAGAAVGTVAAVAVAGMLGAGREHIGPTTGALTLAIVVVLAASLGGRRAGIVTSVAATTAFNFFLVPPYLTLRVEAGQDIAAVLTLGVMGLVVGFGAEQRGRTEESVADGNGAIAALSRIAVMVSEPSEEGLVWRELCRGLELVLGVTDVRFIPGGLSGSFARLPVLDERGAVIRRADATSRGAVRRFSFTRRGLTLPAEGVAVQVDGRDPDRGLVVLTTSASTGSSQQHRMAAVAMVRLWGTTRAGRPVTSL